MSAEPTVQQGGTPAAAADDQAADYTVYTAAAVGGGGRYAGYCLVTRQFVARRRVDRASRY